MCISDWSSDVCSSDLSMFYLAAFPQFIPLGEGAAPAAFLLVCVHALLNAIWFSAVILLFARLMRAARSGRFQHWLKVVTGVVFMAFGVRLAAFNQIGRAHV